MATPRKSRRCGGNCCEIFGDHFTRANSDDPGNYTELGGSDYDVDNNELLCVTGGLLICDTPHPDGATGGQRVRRKFKLTAGTQHARIAVGFQDVSNYLYASLEQVNGCWFLRLFKVSGGAAAELMEAAVISDGVPLNEWHTLEVCLSATVYAYPYTLGDIFRAGLLLADGRRYSLELLDIQDLAGGPKVGLDDSDGVRTDDFYFGRMGSGEACGCPDCTFRECPIEADDFYTENACRWNEISGTWIVSAGSYHGQGGTTILRKGAQSPLDATLISGTATITGNGTSRIKISWKDESNYLFGEIVVDGDGTSIKLGQVDAGSERYLASEEHTYSFVYSGDFCLEYQPGAEKVPEPGKIDTAYPTVVDEFPAGWQNLQAIKNKDGGKAVYNWSASSGLTPAIRMQQWQTGTQSLAEAMPPGSVITGLELVMWGGRAGLLLGNIIDELILLELADSTLSHNMAQGALMPQDTGSGFDFYSWGGEGYLWGFPSLSREELISARFIARWEQTNVATSSLQIDAMALVVWFEGPGQEGGALTFIFGGTTCAAAAPVFGVGTKAGLGAISGDWTFDDIEYKYAASERRPKCPKCPECLATCAYCVDGQSSRLFIVEFSDVQGSYNCADCGDDLNGSFMVELGFVFDLMNCGLSGGIECLAYSGPFPFCAGGLGGQSCAAVRLRIGQNAGVYFLTVQVVYEFASSLGCPESEFGTGFGCQVLFTFTLEQSQPFDCLNFDGLEIPFVSEDGNCSAANAKCRLWSG
jgi:hypothetical protein